MSEKVLICVTLTSDELLKVVRYMYYKIKNGCKYIMIPSGEWPGILKKYRGPGALEDVFLADHGIKNIVTRF